MDHFDAGRVQKQPNKAWNPKWMRNTRDSKAS